jgi:thiamine pyrophosphokinase
VDKEKKQGLKAVIIANGEINDPGRDSNHPKDADLVIAADGGTNHCERFGIVPHLVVGDLDSADPSLVDKMAAAGAKIIRHPARKDQTDLELAVAEAVNRGAGTIVILGGLGGRWDMTLASVLGLAAPELTGITIRLIEGPTEIALLCGNNRISFQGRPGDTLSLLPLGTDTEGVTLKGLEYPLVDTTIQSGSALGVSNVFIESRADIALQNGRLLCIHTRRT